MGALMGVELTITWDPDCEGKPQVNSTRVPVLYLELYILYYRKLCMDQVVLANSINGSYLQPIVKRDQGLGCSHEARLWYSPDQK